MEAVEASSGVDSLLREAQRELDAKHHGEAERLYRRVLDAAPEHGGALEGLGLIALQSKRPEDGLRWLEQARQSEPRNARVLAHLGIAQRQCGRLAEAVASYRGSVELDPQPNAFINLGRAERELGHLDEAIAAFKQAIELYPAFAVGWSVLSNALREAGHFDDAVTAAHTASVFDPWLGDAHLNEGVALHKLGRLAEAAVSYAAASTLAASRNAALGNLKVALADARLKPNAQLPVAVALVRRVLEQPGDAVAWLLLARSQRDAKRAAVAVPCYDRAAEVGDRDLAQLESGEVLCELGKVDEAQRRVRGAFERRGADPAVYRALAEWVPRTPRFEIVSPEWHAILEKCPDDAPSLLNLGVSLQRQGRSTLAIALMRRAALLMPGAVEPFVNLGTALADQGQFDAANEAYLHALELKPDATPVASNRLFCMHFDPRVSPEQLFAEHLDYARRFAATPATRRFATSRDPERRLRIGYVSPDLRWHPVAYFLGPVLEHHDRDRFELHCYSDAEVPDMQTTRLRGFVEHFVETFGWTDARFAEQVESDQIDILVDLAGHTARNRLGAFGRRLAPVQVSWIGYFDTTGLAAMDYRLADAYSVTPEAERFWVERVVRLPRSANCFWHPPAPDPAPAPCLQRGAITFGCFNNPAKISRQVVATFARILHEVPDSRLILKYGGFADPGLRLKYEGWFASEGIPLDRLEIQGHSGLTAFLRAFSQIDIALDPFPYSGETTALHTLWMGVPLVALEGSTLVQRLASRVLRVIGLDEWVAQSVDEYVATARSLASDPERLARLRHELRPRFEASPLGDHAGFTRELEVALREMWRAYCAAPQP